MAGPSGVRRCYIHVGTHKTGTTSIQAFLRDNRQLFAAHGVIVPRSGRSENDAGHHNLTQQLLDSPDFVPEQGGLLDLIDELNNSAQPIACISCEDFSLVSRNRAALIRLKDAIHAAGFAPVVIVYLRPQTSYLVAIYAEIVKNGNVKAFATFVEEVLQHGSFLWDDIPGPPFRYAELLDSFAAVFGREAIVARRYRGAARDNALLESIARIVIGTPVDATAFTFPAGRTNRTRTFGGVLRKFGFEIGADDMRFAPLGLRDTVRLARSFLRSNIDVLRRYGVWIPPCEFRDIVLALPIRNSYRWTRAINRARRALANMGRNPRTAIKDQPVPSPACPDPSA